MHHIKSLSAGFVLLLISSASLAQETKPYIEVPDTLLPQLSYHQKLSRTSVLMQFLGQSIVPSLGLETTIFQYERESLDLRLAGLIVPSTNNSTFSFAGGLQYQKGAKFSRLITGVGVNYLISSRKSYNSVTGGYTTKIEVQDPNGYFMLGYRVQHKHGFFIEVDAMLLYGKRAFLDNISAELPNEHHLSPWAGIVFGYRIPSSLQHQRWKFESAYMADALDAKRTREAIAKKKQMAEDESEVREMYIELRNEGNDIRRRLSPHHFYAEGSGLSAWSLNHDLILKLKKGKNPSMLLTSGIGYTTQLNLPMGIGFGAVNDHLGGFFMAGANLIVTDGLGINPYFGINLQINAYRGVILGFKGYMIFNPSGSDHELLGRVSGNYGMGSLTIGFRPAKKYGYDY